jgi:hypothetical protein
MCGRWRPNGQINNKWVHEDEKEIKEGGKREWERTIAFCIFKSNINMFETSKNVSHELQSMINAVTLDYSLFVLLSPAVLPSTVEVP